MSKLKKWSTGSLTMMSNPQPNPNAFKPESRPMSWRQKRDHVGMTASAAFGPNPRQHYIDRWEELRNHSDPEIRALVAYRDKHGTVSTAQISA